MNGTERSLTLPRSCSTCERLGFSGVAPGLDCFFVACDDSGTWSWKKQTMYIIWDLHDCIIIQQEHVYMHVSSLSY